MLACYLEVGQQDFPCRLLPGQKLAVCASLTLLALQLAHTIDSPLLLRILAVEGGTELAALADTVAPPRVGRPQQDGAPWLGAAPRLSGRHGGAASGRW